MVELDGLEQLAHAAGRVGHISGLTTNGDNIVSSANGTPTLCREPAVTVIIHVLTEASSALNR